MGTKKMLEEADRTHGGPQRHASCVPTSSGNEVGGGRIMARAIWKGSISFGLVNIPVGLYSAETRDEISFQLLDKRNMAPVRYKRVNEESGKEVRAGTTPSAATSTRTASTSCSQRRGPQARRPRGDADGGHRRLRRPRRDRAPLYFDKPYYLAPDKKGAKAYALLRETLQPHRQGRHRQGGDPHPRSTWPRWSPAARCWCSRSCATPTSCATRRARPPRRQGGGHRPRARDGRAPGRGDGRRTGSPRSTRTPTATT